MKSPWEIAREREEQQLKLKYAQDAIDRANMLLHSGFPSRWDPSPAEPETEQETALSKEGKEQDIVSELKSLFKSLEKAEEFYQEIKNKKPGIVLKIAAKYVVNRWLYEDCCHKDIYIILNSNGLYDKSQSNWNMQINKKIGELQEKKKRNEPL